ncbi:hypothetical protein ACSU1N_04920 [Thermogladius sp. 4427co]|uniref:hypothetical protein n=1 Tax=Thermogladius sp. 4427co TaxID=3450718 RepID=UPI003F7B128F
MSPDNEKKPRQARYKPLTEFFRGSNKEQKEPEEKKDSIDDLIKFIVEEKKKSVKPESESIQAPKQRAETGVETKLPAEVLVKIAENPVIKRIECDPSGICKDNMKVGDVLKDDYGIQRKRGFLNTTRMPVFLDWVFENAVAERLTGKTLMVKTERGSLAVIPDHFLCEMMFRYGISIQGFEEKCRDYKPFIGRQFKAKKGRKK